MSDITVITPPDFLSNNNFKMLVINPGVEVRKSLNSVLQQTESTFDLYLYEDVNDSELDWLLQNLESADITVIDIDHCGPIVRNLASYIISKKRTFYLTNDEVTPYNMISSNRIYNLDWLDNYLRGINV